MSRTIHVYGDGDLAHGITHGLNVWGHTIISVTNLLKLDVSAETLWLAADTPVTPLGRTNYGWLDDLAAQVVTVSEAGSLVLVSTQVPVGFTNSLQQHRPDIDFVSVPEYLRRGHTVSGFLDPPVIVIGPANPNFERDRVASLYPANLRDRILWMSPASAEMSKHAMNSYLAVCITFANEMSLLTSLADADYASVEAVLRRDPRIGQHAYLAAGAADGSHFLRDIRYLNQAIPEHLSPLLRTVLELWQQA